MTPVQLIAICNLMNETTSSSDRAALIAVVQPIFHSLIHCLKNSDSDRISPCNIIASDVKQCRPLQQLCDRFLLPPCQRDVLLLCATLELFPQLRDACTRLQKFTRLDCATFGLAQILFPSFEASLLKRQTSINYWQLVAIERGKTLMESPLTIDPFIFLYLIGENDLDEVLENFVYPISYPLDDRATISPKIQETIGQIASFTFPEDLDAKMPYIELCGADRATRRQIAAAVCDIWKCSPYRTTAISLPSDFQQLHQWRRRWERQALLTQSVLLLEVDDSEALQGNRQAPFFQFLSECRTPVIVSTADRSPLTQRQKVSFEIPTLTFAERKKIWSNGLGDRAAPLGGALDILADRFPLPPQSIATICHRTPPFQAPGDLANFLWDACRDRARLQFGTLAQRVETLLNWDDLVLPEDRLATLKEIVAMARGRYVVHYPWGFAEKKNRGLGLCALFTGQSGTGKTTAAEIVAKELNLDCYRVDLSAIVSKYIGETEKNLKQIFDAAEAGSAMLLFDEADALFGKRGEVKEARDRYANQGVSYLLQRLEVYSGVAILTTNLKDAIDSAFERRLKFVIDFPFPDVEQRMEIWKRAFPPQTPTQGLDYERLAQLQVSGGGIANIVFDAAFRAVAEKKAIQMKHLLASARAEAKRTKRNITGRETFGWVRDEKVR